MKFTRRHFVKTMGASLALNPLNLRAYQQEPKAERSPFRHGVASGDPLQDSVILWTRVTPVNNTTGVIPVRWTIASDADFKTKIGRAHV